MLLAAKLPLEKMVTFWLGRAARSHALLAVEQRICVFVCACGRVTLPWGQPDSCSAPPWLKMSGVCETPEGLRTATPIMGGTVTLRPQ